MNQSMSGAVIRRYLAALRDAIDKAGTSETRALKFISALEASGIDIALTPVETKPAPDEGAMLVDTLRTATGAL